MNYGRPLGYENRQMDCGCEAERNMTARQTGCDSCTRQMERENSGCQQKHNSGGCECTCTYMRQKGYLEESESYPIGMSYTPWQSWKNTYDNHRGLMSGTIFPELDKPFCAAGRCMG